MRTAKTSFVIHPNERYPNNVHTLEEEEIKHIYRVCDLQKIEEE
jgi:hypothetical protein